AAFDSLELNSNANKRGEPTAVALARKLDHRPPINGLPAEAARLAARRRRLKELQFQMFALMLKQSSGLHRIRAATKPSPKSQPAPIHADIIGAKRHPSLKR